MSANNMFAVIKTGGRQYKVTRNTVLKIGKISGDAGSAVEFKEVLMIGLDNQPYFIGTPNVKGATVMAEIVEQARDSKVLIFKKNRRHNYRRRQGHRQYVTQVLIKDIIKA